MASKKPGEIDSSGGELGDSILLAIQDDNYCKKTILISAAILAFSIYILIKEIFFTLLLAGPASVIASSVIASNLVSLFGGGVVLYGDSTGLHGRHLQSGFAFSSLEDFSLTWDQISRIRHRQHADDGKPIKGILTIHPSDGVPIQFDEVQCIQSTTDTMNGIKKLLSSLKLESQIRRIFHSCSGLSSSRFQLNSAGV